MWLLWYLVLVHLEMVLVLEQDRCTVCAKHTMGSEITLEIVLILTQDWCIVYAERTTGLEIILDTPDGTPR
jgi:hypothetical protein